MKALNQFIRFSRPGTAECVTEELASSKPAPGEALIQTEVSLVSPGTELACLSGREAWAPLPFIPGYACVGQVLEADKDSPWKTGDRVFTMGRHSRITQTEILTVAVPEGLSPEVAVWVRLGGVAMTAQRLASAALGEWVVVLGLGTVGNLAAQLFQLSGCRVIGFDVSEGRRQMATQVGIEHVLAPGLDQKEAVRAITGGELASSVVDATGRQKVAMEASLLARKGGEVILLGSPRGEHTADVTPLLQRIHLWGEGAVTYKGAHEWVLPVRSHPHLRFSMEKNYRVLLSLLEKGSLRVRELTTHIVPPEQAPDIYARLQTHPDLYLGVIFDWRNDPQTC